MQAKELRLPMTWGHVAAKAWGSPNDERVLLVHGILDNAGSFDRLISLLPPKYYLVCIDLPGHGLSSHFPPGLPLDYMNYVFVIRKILDSLKWSSCIFIGHSLGATIGLIFGSLYPDKVERILCFDATVVRPLKNQKLVSQIQKLYDNTVKFEGDRAANLYTEEELMYTFINLRYNTLNTPAARTLIERSVTKVGDKYKFNRDRRLVMGLYPLLNCEQYFTILSHLKAPVTVVFSSATLSGKYHEDIVELDTKFRSSHKYKVVVVEGNHDVHNNYPERVAPHVYQFLSNLKSSL